VPELCAVLGHTDHTSWVCTAIGWIHTLLTSMLVLPGERLVTLPNQDSPDDLPTHSFDDFHHVVRACDDISELIHCIHTHLDPGKHTDKIPSFLANPLRNVIVGLARLPLVNSYARTPPLVWKLGWMPSPSGELKTKLPPLPLEFLQEKDVLMEFIFRVNLIGWTSRQQFEETWMSLLGVLNPVQTEDEIAPEEATERSQSAVLAVQCITALLLQSMLTPHCGNPSNSTMEHHPRDKPLKSLQTRCGRKLTHIRQIIQSELDSSGNVASPGNDVISRPLAGCNLERGREEHVTRKYGLAQISVSSMWSLVGVLEAQPAQQDSSSDTGTDSYSIGSPDSTPLHSHSEQTDNTESSVSDRQTDAVDGQVQQQGQTDTGMDTQAEPGSVDLRSCLQFLLDLYGQFLAPSNPLQLPLIQINETLKSVVQLSDVFTERSHYEWMLDVLLELLRVHPGEDELMMQYLTVGICKAAAVTRADSSISERLCKLLESSMKSPHLPCRMAALYGALYVLETGYTAPLTQALLPMVVDYLSKNMSVGTSHVCEENSLLVWSSTFYICENYQDNIKEDGFINKIVTAAILTAQSGEDVISLPVYLAILRGLERLLLAGALTKQHAEALTKLSVDRLRTPSPQRSLAALGLMLTSIYSERCNIAGKQQDAYTPTTECHVEFPAEGEEVMPDPESLIVAMERVTVLFERIRKGFPGEARVITRILPTFLADFFPPQDIMNKVIGEFLSAQQPHPQLMAGVLFKVFGTLLSRQQHALVRDWVMLSLSNFTQRTPLAMAIWSLTCFFTSASENSWLRALFPHILSRIGRLELVDRRLFCLAALDLRAQLSDVSQRHAFLSTFQAVAQPDTPYLDLVNLCQT